MDGTLYVTKTPDGFHLTVNGYGLAEGRVDLGLVNKAEYYTGIVFRGYIEEYGQAVLSGGRYDTLIGSFGADDMPAVGFAVNVNAIAAANLRSNRSTKARHAEVLVFAADEDLIDGISHCTKLISKGHDRRVGDWRTVVTADSSCHAGRDRNDHEVRVAVLKYSNNDRDQDSEGTPGGSRRESQKAPHNENDRREEI